MQSLLSNSQKILINTSIILLTLLCPCSLPASIFKPFYFPWVDRLPNSYWLPFTLNCEFVYDLDYFVFLFGLYLLGNQFIFHLIKFAGPFNACVGVRTEINKLTISRFASLAFWLSGFSTVFFIYISIEPTKLLI